MADGLRPFTSGVGVGSRYAGSIEGDAEREEEEDRSPPREDLDASGDRLLLLAGATGPDEADADADGGGDALPEEAPPGDVPGADEALLLRISDSIASLSACRARNPEVRMRDKPM